MPVLTAEEKQIILNARVLTASTATLIQSLYANDLTKQLITELGEKMELIGGPSSKSPFHFYFVSFD